MNVFPKLNGESRGWKIGVGQKTFNGLEYIQSKEELTGHERCRLKRPWVIEVNVHGLHKEDDST